MTPLQAAYRLLTSTPKERIHTHTWDGIEEGSPGRRRSPSERLRLKAELQRSRAKGMTVRELCKEHRCTMRTIRSLLGPLKRERWEMSEEHKERCKAALAKWREQRKAAK